MRLAFADLEPNRAESQYLEGGHQWAVSKHRMFECADYTDYRKTRLPCVRKCPAMAAIKYKVELTEAERSRLNEVSQRGKASVRTVKRALSLLKADQGLRDREIADVLLVNAATVARARQRYVAEGLEAASNDRPRPGQERKLDGKQEAHLIALACSAAPAGHTHWTLQLLADQVGGGVGVCR